MKKKLFLMLVVILISAVVLAACSTRYENQINVGGLNVRLKADRYPLAKGDNQLAVIIIGSAQRTITDARVDARFYMPNVPGMLPMDSKMEAVLKGDKYLFTVNPAIPGVWKLDLTVARPEERALTTTFNIEAQ